MLRIVWFSILHGSKVDSRETSTRFWNLSSSPIMFAFCHMKKCHAFGWIVVICGYFCFVSFVNSQTESKWQLTQDLETSRRAFSFCQIVSGKKRYAFVMSDCYLPFLERGKKRYPFNFGVMKMSRTFCYCQHSCYARWNRTVTPSHYLLAIMHLLCWHSTERRERETRRAAYAAWMMECSADTLLLQLKSIHAAGMRE